MNDSSRGSRRRNHTPAITAGGIAHSSRVRRQSPVHSVKTIARPDPKAAKPLMVSAFTPEASAALSA